MEGHHRNVLVGEWALVPQDQNNPKSNRPSRLPMGEPTFWFFGLPSPPFPWCLTSQCLQNPHFKALKGQCPSCQSLPYKHETHVCVLVFSEAHWQSCSDDYPRSLTGKSWLLLQLQWEVYRFYSSPFRPFQIWLQGRGRYLSLIWWLTSNHLIVSGLVPTLCLRPQIPKDVLQFTQLILLRGKSLFTLYILSTNLGS